MDVLVSRWRRTETYAPNVSVFTHAGINAAMQHHLCPHRLRTGAPGRRGLPGLAYSSVKSSVER